MAETLLIGMGAWLYRAPSGELHIEAQALSGLHGWRENFDKVIGFAICGEGTPPKGWVPVPKEINSQNIELIALPDTFRFKTMLRNRKIARELLSRAVCDADYRVYTCGGWIGDPGEIAASLTVQLGLSHAIWIDRVNSQVALSDAKDSFIGRVDARIRSWIIEKNSRNAVARSDLAMLHGKTLAERFGPLAKRFVKVENIHFGAKDRIDECALQEKQISAMTDPIKIVYAGRASPMKGGLFWIDVLAELNEKGVPFRAKWLGDGSELEEMKARAATKKIDESIDFLGFIANPDTVRIYYREAHVFLFCHVTDESPRNLVESLHSATPIVGFGCEYSNNLVSEKGGGHLVSRGDTTALADALADLSDDRQKLSELIGRASKSASNLTRDQVFKDRALALRDAFVAH